MSDAEELNLSNLASYLRDPESAAEFLEGIRWPDGPVCPHCGEHERPPYRLKGKSTRRRLWKCRACRKQFTVTVGTIFESSHIALDKWLLAFWLLCSSKKGMSANQLHRMLDVTYKTAWFMFHRIREAMRDPAFTSRLRGVVEVDETYVGYRTKGGKPGRGSERKVPVMSLVERGGRVRSERLATVTGAGLKDAVRKHVAPDARVMTDSFPSYRGLDRDFASHETVSHTRGEYVRGDVHINTAENYFSLLKRGIVGSYHHVSPAHLPRYLDEFDFRYNSREASDGRRTVAALAGAEGKRLKYRQGLV